MLLAMGLAFTALPCQPAKRRFTVADDIGLAHFGYPYGTGLVDAVTFSPDGRYFVVDTERGLLDRDRPESTLRIYTIGNIRRFLLRSEMSGEPSPPWTFRKSTNKDGPIITHIRWLADSSGVAFLAKTASGNDELFLADLKTKTVHALTPDNEHVTSFDIRDREHLVYSVLSPIVGQKALADSKATSIVGTGRGYIGTLVFPENLYPARSRFHDLSELWAVENGKRFRVHFQSSGRPILLHSYGQSVIALSPDGRFVVTALTVDLIPREWETQYAPSLTYSWIRIRAGRQDPEALDGYGYVSEFVVIELSTGKVKRITNAPTGASAGWWSLPGVEWSSHGTLILLVNTFLPPETHDPDGRLNRPCVAVVDVPKAKVTCVERWQEDTKTNTGFEDRHRITTARFDRGSSGRLTVDYWEMDQTAQSTSAWSKKSTRYMCSDNGSWTVAGTMNGWAKQDRAIEVKVNESFTDPPVLVATDTTTKISRVILDPNPQLKNIQLGEARVYTWKDKEGREWRGGLFKPSDYKEGQLYPLVIQTHGFKESAFIPSGAFPSAFAARPLAAAGMVVLQVDEQCSSGTPAEGPCAVTGYEAGANQLVLEGLVDPDKIGIVGFSRTSYYVLKALTRSTQHFKAASITDGSNVGYLTYIFDADANGIIAGADAATIGAHPFGKGLRDWLERSPEFNMDKVTTPLQVVAIGPGSLLASWEPYAALRSLNKPVDLIILRQGTHVLTNPAERMASQGGTVDWFRFWLKDEEDLDPAKAPQYARWRELRKLQEQNARQPQQASPPPVH